jgi:hypothetical protein
LLKLSSVRSLGAMEKLHVLIDIVSIIYFLVIRTVGHNETFEIIV